MDFKLSFSQRLKAFFTGALQVETETPKAEAPEKKSPAPSPTNKTNEAQQTLVLLQKHARLIDFIHENIDDYSDEEVGAGARIVHQGCQKVFKDYIQIEPLNAQEEESAITLEENFNAQEIKLTGNISGAAPFKGTLVHRGWKIKHLNLPTSNDQNTHIIAPAEVAL